ncbi:hypothetical protein DFH06DRAFT_130590 [Mycena polygramma]|nr:hypothetical protein DFH06DRAFT_130590 [Mycena polygramma]
MGPWRRASCFADDGGKAQVSVELPASHEQATSEGRFRHCHGPSPVRAVQRLSEVTKSSSVYDPCAAAEDVEGGQGRVGGPRSRRNQGASPFYSTAMRIELDMKVLPVHEHPRDKIEVPAILEPRQGFLPADAHQDSAEMGGQRVEKVAKLVETKTKMYSTMVDPAGEILSVLCPWTRMRRIPRRLRAGAENQGAEEERQDSCSETRAGIAGSQE